MARTAKTEDQPATVAVDAPDAASTTTEAAIRTPRPGSKLAAVVDLLERDTGASIAEVMVATGWQSHTVRGALSGMITKKLGKKVTSEKTTDRGRVYRIEPLTT